MPKFAANLTMLYADSAFLDRFARAHASGFRFVEYLFPYRTRSRARWHARWRKTI